MAIQSIQFDASAEIAKRKEQIRSQRGGSAFSDVFQRALCKAGDPNTLASVDGYGYGYGQSTLESTDLDPIFQQASQTYGVPVNLLKAVAKAESNFNPDAVSSAGAMGVMQLMPGTAKSLGVTDAHDPEQNIMGGAKYLSEKLKLYDGDVELALAAYNAGSGNVAKYGGVPPFPETQNYIKKIGAYMGQGSLSTSQRTDGMAYINEMNSAYGNSNGMNGLYGSTELNNLNGLSGLNGLNNLNYLNNLNGVDPFSGQNGGYSLNGNSNLNDRQRMMLRSYQQMAGQAAQLGKLPDDSSQY